MRDVDPTRLSKRTARASLTELTQVAGASGSVWYSSCYGRLVTVVRRVALVSCAIALSVSFPRSAIALCGDANRDGKVVSSDALAVLQSAVGLDSACHANCDCDVDGNRFLTSSDALRVLRGAVTGHVAGCDSFGDGCFKDSDCDPGYYCGADPDWTCDAACVPE